MDELLAFVHARLDEEERDAREAGAEEVWREDGATVIRGHPTDQVVDWVYDDRARHIARQDPRATLARVAALRALVAGWEVIQPEQGTRPSVVAASARDDLEALAAVWAWHPDYREAWRVTDATPGP